MKIQELIETRYINRNDGFRSPQIGASDNNGEIHYSISKLTTEPPFDYRFIICMKGNEIVDFKDKNGTMNVKEFIIELSK